MGAIELAVDLSIRPDILSGPLAFEVSRVVKRFKTSSSVQRNSSGQASGQVWKFSMSSAVKGGRDWLKHSEKNWLSIDALPISEPASTVPCFSVGMVLLDFDCSLTVFQNCFELGLRPAKYILLACFSSFNALFLADVYFPRVVESPCLCAFLNN